MKGTLKTLTAIALVALLTFGSSMSAFAATNARTLHASMHDPVIPGFTTMKFEDPVDDEKTIGGITIEVDFSWDDKWVDWESSLPVEYVYVKGGNQGGYLYHYPNGATSDEDLRAPNNVNNNVNIQTFGGGYHNPQPDISHVTFYYKIKGSITIVKKVLGNPPNNEVFEFEIVGPSGTQSVFINGAGSATVPNLIIGAYTISEINIPDDYSVDDDAVILGLN